MRSLIDRLTGVFTWLLLSVLTLGLALVVIPTAYLILPVIWGALGLPDLPFKLPFPGACISETFGKASNIAGADFEFVDTDCDLIAKDEAITISVSRGPGLLDWFGKTEIFKYDGIPEIKPVVTAVDRHTVRISVEAVSSVHFAKKRWEDLTIVYDIGSIEYPRKGDP
jgi:hypothetical protein